MKKAARIILGASRREKKVHKKVEVMWIIQDSKKKRGGKNPKNVTVEFTTKAFISSPLVSIEKV